MIIHARVFEKDGNRFLIPGYWYCDEDASIGLHSVSNVIIDGMMVAVCCRFKADGWLDVEADEHGRATVPHFLMDCIGPQFAHGGISVWLISGPLFAQQIDEHTVKPT